MISLTVCVTVRCVGGHESRNKETKTHYKSAFGNMERQTDKRPTSAIPLYEYKGLKSQVRNTNSFVPTHTDYV